jgi:hypothetical protein
MAAVNRSPEKRALCAEQMRRFNADPDFVSAMNAARPKAHARTRATRLAWCSREHWETNAALARKRVPLADRQRLIAEMVHHDAKREIAARQLRMQRKHERDLRERY